MYVAYDQRSISILNRVADACQIGPSLPQSRGYIYGSLGTDPITGAMWMYADAKTDWGADTDVVLDTHPIIDRINAEIIVPSLGEKPKPEINLWDVYDDAVRASCELENRIYLACVVINAYIALEAGIDGIWQQNDDGKTERVNDEFVADREIMDIKIRQMFLEWSDKNPGENADALKQLLLKTTKQIRREMKLAQKRVAEDEYILNLDYDLNEIKPGSRVRHIAEGWEGMAVCKAKGDAIRVRRQLSDDDVVFNEVIADELAVVVDA